MSNLRPSKIDYTELPSPRKSVDVKKNWSLLSQSKTASVINSYLIILSSLLSQLSSSDIELLLLTNQRIACVVGQLLTSLWSNALFLHELLMQKNVLHEKKEVSFIKKNSIENLKLSLEGLTLPSSFQNKKAKISLFEIYSFFFEKIDTLLDLTLIHKYEEYATINKRNQKTAQLFQLEDGSLILGASFGQAVPRPQLGFFDSPCDNSRNAKFSIRPEAVELGAPSTKEIESLFYSGIALKNLLLVIDDFINTVPDNLKAPSYELMIERPLIFIDTISHLKDFIVQLNNQQIFAIDVEYHSLRSFRGFSCLIQISTISQDVIIDAIALREQLYLLNVPFGNPSKLKIFHGCHQDIIWLQKDFSIFIAGIFDTFIASSDVLSLSLPSFSLASLVTHFCSRPNQRLIMDKELQLADWRIRPLSSEMIKYARADTYFLFALFVNLVQTASRNLESPKGWVEWTIRESSSLGLKIYRPETEDSDHTLEIKDALIKAQKSLTSPLSVPSIRAFHALWEWRDTFAREEDESLKYVLPSFMLIKIAQRLPSDAQSVLACCNPVPPLIRQHASDIALLVWKAASEINSIIPINISSEQPKDTQANELENISINEIVEYQDKINEEVKELLDGDKGPITPMIQILRDSLHKYQSTEISSKLIDIQSTFMLKPWQLIKTELNELESIANENINSPFVIIEKTEELTHIFEDLTKKEPKKKKHRKMDPLEFISTPVVLSTQCKLDELEIAETEVQSFVLDNLPVLKEIKEAKIKKRKQFQSAPIEIPKGFDTKKKKQKKKSSTSLSKSFLN